MNYLRFTKCIKRGVTVILITAAIQSLVTAAAALSRYMVLLMGGNANRKSNGSSGAISIYGTSEPVCKILTYSICTK